MAKRLIDANAYAYPGDLVNEPTVDAVEVVRCRDCKYWDDPICVVHSGWPDQYSTGHMDYTDQKLSAPTANAKTKNSKFYLRIL